MKREETNREEQTEILDIICVELMKHGLKATTMDSVAAALKISKRTLYEIFESKEAMFRAAGDYFHNKLEKEYNKIFSNSPNVMVAILKCFELNRNLMSKLSIEFIRDINELSEKNSESNEVKRAKANMLMYNLLDKGKEEGYFRKDVNLMVQLRMFRIQMESLKRMEELFPPDITLLEVFDNITIGFFRSICSPKGLELLEKEIPLLNLSVTN